MAQYIVIAEEAHEARYAVEAENEEEAKRKVMTTECHEIDTRFKAKGRMMRLLLILLMLCGCKYKGTVARYEYSHNIGLSEFAATHVSAGPIVSPQGITELEFMFAVGPELRAVHDEPEPAALINPRVMWFFAPDSFLQVEADWSINDDDNLFLFFQFEKRF